MRKVAIVANTSKPDWLSTARSIVRLLGKRSVEVIVEPEEAAGALFPERSESPEAPMAELDMVISLGGDGTFLRAVRFAGERDVPMAGVNLGGLGFLAEFSADTFLHSLDRILAGDYRIEERMTLQACLVREGKTIRKERALNDVVIRSSGLPRLAVLRTTVDDEYLTTYVSDGLIVATPTGSTAYSLSAGGPVVEPSLEALLVTPICPHASPNRPILIPPHRTIRIVPVKVPEGAMLAVDGQTGVELLCGDAVTVSRSDRNVRLITVNEAPYFEILRSKLGWGGSKEG